MKIEGAAFSGCPDWQETDARLRRTLPRAGVDADVVLVDVTTPEDAERLRFRGSPNGAARGTDPLAHDSDPVRLSCRVFRTPAGLRGAPAVEHLRRGEPQHQRSVEPDGCECDDRDRQPDRRHRRAEGKVEARLHQAPAGGPYSGERLGRPAPAAP